jgi:hypothetical protein
VRRRWDALSAAVPAPFPGKTAWDGTQLAPSSHAFSREIRLGRKWETSAGQDTIRRINHFERRYTPEPDDEIVLYVHPRRLPRRYRRRLEARDDATSEQTSAETNEDENEEPDGDEPARSEPNEAEVEDVPAPDDSHEPNEPSEDEAEDVPAPDDSHEPSEAVPSEDTSAVFDAEDPSPNNSCRSS